MAERDDRADTRRSLSLIARTLGVPPDSFLPRSEDATPGAATAAEEDELLSLFRAIRSDGGRRHLLRLARAMADR